MLTKFILAHRQIHLEPVGHSKRAVLGALGHMSAARATAASSSSRPSDFSEYFLATAATDISDWQYHKFSLASYRYTVVPVAVSISNEYGNRIVDFWHQLSADTRAYKLNLAKEATKLG